MAQSQEPLPDTVRFDYGELERDIVDAIRARGERIRQKYGKKTLKDVIEIGNDFLATKAVLPRRFCSWLRAEVNYTSRTATSYMAAAEWIGGKWEIISQFSTPTAALKLAAPWVPEEARLSALRRAEAGEKITTTVADDIIAAVCKKLGIRIKPPSDARLRSSLVNVLQKCAKRQPSSRFRLLAERLVDQFDVVRRAQNIGKGTRL